MTTPENKTGTDRSNENALGCLGFIPGIMRLIKRISQTDKYPDIINRDALKTGHVEFISPIPGQESPPSTTTKLSREQIGQIIDLNALEMGIVSFIGDLPGYEHIPPPRIAFDNPPEDNTNHLHGAE